MSKHNNGGPAFPDDSQADYTGGMSLRDYFAAKAQDMSGDATVEYAEALLGRSRPDKTSSEPEVIIAWTRFWNDANAVYKYMQADAMLAARETSHDE